MKNIVYLSKAKLDTYGPQVPRKFLSGGTAKLKFDVGVMSAEIGAAAVESSTEIERLANLIAYLETEKLVGTAADPKPFLKGIVMASALFDPPRVYLGGTIAQSEGDITLCLCASAKHFIGYDPAVERIATRADAVIGSVDARVFHQNLEQLPICRAIDRTQRRHAPPCRIAVPS